MCASRSDGYASRVQPSTRGSRPWPTERSNRCGRTVEAVIGRDGPVKPFALIRWAREQASVEHRGADGSRTKLKPIESHLLLVLATYANADATAWPSVRTLAMDCGLKPYRDGRCSAVSAALQRLGDLQLIWTKQGGRGRSARRELLCKPVQPQGEAVGEDRAEIAEPLATARSNDAETHGRTEGKADNLTAQPHVPTCAQPHAVADQNYQGEENRTTKKQNDQESLPPWREASATDRREEQDTIDLEAELRAIEAVEDPRLKERLFAHL